ncbi:hypothetical protein [Thermomonas carbonis]|uniref:DUF3108 domain-containing protein n=1 Tax=Thermomonas carbonis TaxID=1463158 RepID=A0A7G9SQF2_9GAMM|nr:hypothetical protein [Thermomonas carbonis]QNN70077.1 hypothetical protein H9L16_15930 [Thermomonas carbonis]GHB97584.1 hypothetical protein GCM10010080_07180 [Thermomonas carbonis]
MPGSTRPRQLALALGLGAMFAAGIAAAADTAAGNLVRYVGDARDPGGRLLYREAHYVDSRGASPRRVVLYQCADGRAFARKMVDGAGPAPAFAFLDARDGYQEGVRTRAGKREVFWQAGKSAPVKRSPVDKTGASVFDAGFDAYVREHFAKLQQGKSVQARFLIPSRQSAIGVSVKPVAGAPAGYLDLKTRLDAWYGFALPELKLRYRIADRQLVRFEGIGTIRDAKGGHGKLRIDFARPAVAIEAAEMQRVRDLPLGGACGGGM